MQMDLDARVMLLALTKNRWPGCKKDVALFIVANDQGAELGTICSQRVISEQTGISTSLVRRYLRELVDEGVLERHDGGGPRGHAFRFHDFARWRSRWFGAHARFDRDWPLKRESAVGQLLLLLRPENARKTRSAARPVAPLSTTAARSVASLYAPTGATGRAAADPLLARPVAPQGNGAIATDTSLLIEEPSSVTEGASESAELLLATINQRAGAPIFGAPARQVRAFAGADDVADLIAAVHSAPPGLKVSAYVEIVGQARARRGLQMSAPLRPEIVEWREALPDEDSAPPPWRGTGQSGLDWAVASCETATGGAQ